MSNIRLYLAILLALWGFLPSVSMATANLTSKGLYRFPFYMGGVAGYGKTTWEQLVPEEPNATLALSTPIGVTEGGAVYGAYAGYEIIPEFAFETSYMRYPNANVQFDPVSLFSFYNNGQTTLTTHTEAVELVGKIMLLIPYTCGFRAYSTFGAAGVHRFDSSTDRWRLSPTFGVGFNYLLTEHLMVELGTEYVAGYGQSEIEPDQHYVPFLYSGFVRMAVRV